jgi:dTDP-glucose 4,6-dehydratase
MSDSPVDVYGSGLQIRDWIYVEDHCKALVEVSRRGRVGQSYNIGGECELKNIELVHRIAGLMNKEPIINFIKDRPGHDQRYSTSNDKITTETPWTVSTKLDDGLLKTIEYSYDNYN